MVCAPARQAGEATGFRAATGLQREHALNLDFVNEALGTGTRVAVEFIPNGARALATTILRLIDKGARAEGSA